ncbi:hypothetical protein [Aureibacter tunicatorum]|uniref:Uncharacterized protein n=1 Tax=Aureibacter tunicatorum TaxID=866807 RepID=A0AAE3XPX1_9BACT|nr:hypothetical protein [Aureibacter tunicatorum]MDR6239179.1 hypothetical protein [Aureibacter tunicatorum]BDD04895.1 hypothetical protein AUTU_23780 [Aureibacter tunicatorum]
MIQEIKSEEFAPNVLAFDLSGEFSWKMIFQIKDIVKENLMANNNPIKVFLRIDRLTFPHTNADLIFNSEEGKKYYTHRDNGLLKKIEKLVIVGNSPFKEIIIGMDILMNKLSLPFEWNESYFNIKDYNKAIQHINK